jgi:hypothetical protein
MDRLCAVMIPVVPTTCALTARLSSASTLPGRGSLTAIAPGGMRTVVLPLKVSWRLDPGTTAAPDWCRPT